jgi:hypothetical protein
MAIRIIKIIIAVLIESDNQSEEDWDALRASYEVWILGE